MLANSLSGLFSVSCFVHFSSIPGPRVGAVHSRLGFLYQLTVRTIPYRYVHRPFWGKQFLICDFLLRWLYSMSLKLTRTMATFLKSHIAMSSVFGWCNLETYSNLSHLMSWWANYWGEKAEKTTQEFSVMAASVSADTCGSTRGQIRVRTIKYM